MDRYNAEVNWSEEQCSRISKVVQAEAQKARVAAQFLPTNPVSDVTAVAVPNRTLTFPGPFMNVDHMPTIGLTTFGVNIRLTGQEMADPEQSSALIQFRRAANVIARLEDALIFRGQTDVDTPPDGVGGIPLIYDVHNRTASAGLFGPPVANPPVPNPPRSYLPITPRQNVGAGTHLAAQIIAAIGVLEAAGQNRPFACVLGQTAFANLHDPTAAMILPRDRVVPFLEGPLLRSSTLDANSGIVVALGGSPMEIVVSSELHVRFLQVTPDPYFVFRLSERIALRATDLSAVCVLHP